MKPSGLVVLASLCAGATALSAADATSPVDAARRNAPFAPAASVQPATRAPERHDALQEKRVTPATVDKPAAALGERRAAIDLAETKAKHVIDKDVRAPEPATAREMSAFDGRRADYATATDTAKPPLVARYQDSLAAASASNMARFPAMDGATSAKINRFVFRKNAPEPADAALSGAAVTPAGSAPLR